MKTARLFFFFLWQNILILEQKLLEMIINGIFFYLREEKKIVTVKCSIHYLSQGKTRVIIDKNSDVRFHCSRVPYFSVTVKDGINMHYVQISKSLFNKLNEQMGTSLGKVDFSEICFKSFYGLIAIETREL